MLALKALVPVAVVLFLLAIVFAITGNDTGTSVGWQGGLIVLGLALVAGATRFIPPGPWGLDLVEGNAFDDPESFWGRFNRFFREERSS